MAFFEGIAWWQALLGALVIAWIVQIFGTMRQMRHYRIVLGEVNATYTNGFMGAGNSRGNFGSGVIAIVVATPDEIIRRVLVMEGRSVFAKFTPVSELEGKRLGELGDHEFGPKGAGRRQAVMNAVEQITKVMAGRAEANTAMEPAVLAGAEGSAMLGAAS